MVFILAGTLNNNSGTIIGGGGGASGANNGGAGSAAIVFNSGGILNNNAGTITGGSGGASTGYGGNGGAAISGSAATIINSGSITGGGGASNDFGGSGGVGIIGDTLTIVDTGTIGGGSGGVGRYINGTSGNAITFTSGINSLELQAGYVINGNVVGLAGINTLILGGAANASFDVSQIAPTRQYRGFTALEKSGTSTWTLTGIMTATTPWTVRGGTLDVEGSIASSTQTTVNAGATLMGAGIVGTTLIESGGRLSPGNGTPGSAMTVTGDLTLQPGAFYVVNVNAATASTTNVSGTATVGGATVNAVYAHDAIVEKHYTILTANGGVNGTFNNLINTNLPADFTASLAYDANNAFLNISLSFIPPESGESLNHDQQAVADTLVDSFNKTGGIPLEFGELTLAGLTQVSGELATGSQQATFDAMSQFMGVMTDASGAGRDLVACGNAGAANYFVKAPRQADCTAPRWSTWVAGYGGGRTTDGNAVIGSNKATSSVFGVAVGADYRISPETVAGFALAGGGTSFSVANAFGSGRSDLFQAGVYARHDIGAAYLTGALAYGWQDITTNRTLTIDGIDRLHANFNANAFSGRLESGYRFGTPWMGLTLYAAGQFTTLDLPGYAERALVGSDIFALAYAGKTVTASRSELGLRGDKSFGVEDGVLTLRARAAWAHNFDTGRSIAASFEALPGTSFVVNSAAIDHDAALTTASAEMTWRNGWSLAATFDGEFSDVSSNYTGKGVLRYRW